jgi:hypothetical protein
MSVPNGFSVDEYLKGPKKLKPPQGNTSVNNLTYYEKVKQFVAIVTEVTLKIDLD